MSSSIRIRRLLILVPAGRRSEAEMIGRLVGRDIGRELGCQSGQVEVPHHLMVNGAGASPPLISQRAGDVLKFASLQSSSKKKE
jgi:hypothetical protein